MVLMRLTDDILCFKNAQRNLFRLSVFSNIWQSYNNFCIIRTFLGIMA